MNRSVKSYSLIPSKAAYGTIQQMEVIIDFQGAFSEGYLLSGITKSKRSG